MNRRRFLLASAAAFAVPVPPAPSFLFNGPINTVPLGEAIPFVEGGFIVPPEIAAVLGMASASLGAMLDVPVLVGEGQRVAMNPLHAITRG